MEIKLLVDEKVITTYTEGESPIRFLADIFTAMAVADEEAQKAKSIARKKRLMELTDRWLKTDHSGQH
ncbi:hypothetical protein Xmau_00301 [Xenorhabdus mauleonii]|uniref:Uncharacterized protein n=1 Tax=Xenorhabdus mauleonii TaxID=351675 RepID=A0A1I3U608_9GAMM|nr:hypothetical protein [Xenorhabdus mauleonii]PHM45910.1 hypothetical protein Xmau_00301 [Xenorhabdus mauleonii]SFJ78163.1 hypothetical protein SAMN05421680_11616 [Xenorhabdus mauleonii]